MQNLVRLAYGEVMLYNIQERSPYWRIKAPDGFNWGSIYSISPYGISNAVLNDWVLYKGSEAVCVLAFGHNKQYPIIEEAKLVTTEIPPP